MKAFWWFEDGLIAGMARPGFNNVKWFELTFEEGVLLSWLGRYSSGHHNRSEFQEHLESYVPKMAKFYKFNPKQVDEKVAVFNCDKTTEQFLGSLADKTKLFKKNK